MPFVEDDRELVDESNGCVVARSVVRAAGGLARGLGMMVYRPALGQALWLEPCNGVHTIALRAPIDVIVLNRSMRVVALRCAVHPWRFVPPVRGGHATVELEAGAIAAAGVALGDVLQLSEASGSRERPGRPAEV
jgi:uncharacterized protein